jgi:putative nucleotidyltransferase with HDIG domain
LHRLNYRELAMKSLDKLPPFSPVFNHLMASLGNESASLAELSGVIERDTILSGNVLRLVNSVLYGRRGTISNVRHALAIIGLTKLRNYVLGLSISQLWKKVSTAASWSMGRFNQHSAATAVLADLIVQRLPVEAAEAAFAAGLLHDIGRFMIAVALPEEYERIVTLMTRDGHTSDQAEREVLECSHSELGAAALARWNLPVSIQRAVAGSNEGSWRVGSGGPRGLGQIVQASSSLADHLGYGITPLESDRARDAREVFDDLSLGPIVTERIVADFETELNSLLAAA